MKPMKRLKLKHMTHMTLKHMTHMKLKLLKHLKHMRDKKWSVSQIDGRHPDAWPEGVAHFLDRLYAEVRGVQVRLIQLFQVENGAWVAIFLGDEKNGEMGPEARHGFQGVRMKSRTSFQKGETTLRRPPQPLDCKRRGEAERGKERNRPGPPEASDRPGTGAAPLIALTGTWLNRGIAAASLRLEVKGTA
jgi:hypothetical protein